MSLIEKIRKARQSVVKVGEGGQWSITITRPTDMDVVEMQTAGRLSLQDILRRFVVGWSGVREIDLIPGGAPDAVAFSADLFMEWIADKPALWAPLNEAILGSYRAHEAALEDAAKNLPPG